MIDSESLQRAVQPHLVCLLLPLARVFRLRSDAPTDDELVATDLAVGDGDADKAIGNNAHANAIAKAPHDPSLSEADFDADVASTHADAAHVNDWTPVWKVCCWLARSSNLLVMFLICRIADVVGCRSQRCEETVEIERNESGAFNCY